MRMIRQGSPSNFDREIVLFVYFAWFAVCQPASFRLQLRRAVSFAAKKFGLPFLVSRISRISRFPNPHPQPTIFYLPSSIFAYVIFMSLAVTESPQPNFRSQTGERTQNKRLIFGLEARFFVHQKIGKFANKKPSFLVAQKFVHTFVHFVSSKNPYTRDLVNEALTPWGRRPPILSGLKRRLAACSKAGNNRKHDSRPKTVDTDRPYNSAGQESSFPARELLTIRMRMNPHLTQLCGRAALPRRRVDVMSQAFCSALFLLLSLARTRVRAFLTILL